MKIIILASLILFCSLLSMKMKRSKKEDKDTEQSFWNREHQANAVRRKPLDHLEYITIPMDRFPTGLLRENLEINDCIETLEVLSGVTESYLATQLERGFSALDFYKSLLLPM